MTRDLFGREVFDPIRGEQSAPLFHQPVDVRPVTTDTPADAKIRRKFHDVGATPAMFPTKEAHDGDPESRQEGSQVESG